MEVTKIPSSSFVYIDLCLPIAFLSPYLKTH